MNDAFPKSYFDRRDLVSLLPIRQALKQLHGPPYTEPYVRWYERTDEELILILLLDWVGLSVLPYAIKRKVIDLIITV